MAKVVIVGAGFAGHYAALVLQDAIKGKGNHEITVISRVPKFTYIPSLVWVGVGQMRAEETQFDLKPVYDKVGINYIHGTVTEVHPDPEDQYVVVNLPNGQTQEVKYDYIIIATGPYLNFAAVEGLGPENGYTQSICTPPHATEAASKYLELVNRLQKGERAKIIIGTGHGLATCQGAAFEYICNIHNDLVDRGLRDRVELMWLSNEPALGDFGIDGLETKYKGKIFTSEDMARYVFEQYGIKWEIRSHVRKVEEGKVYTVNLDGEEKEFEFDFAMLIPPFKAQPIKWIDKDGNDITDKMCNPAGFVKVDANYGKPYDE
ncbi:MAG: NAD(P)/FAD-dependent oxidoreductase, partial [Persephonella sp.]